MFAAAAPPTDWDERSKSASIASGSGRRFAAVASEGGGLAVAVAAPLTSTRGARFWSSGAASLLTPSSDDCDSRRCASFARRLPKPFVDARRRLWWTPWISRSRPPSASSWIDAAGGASASRGAAFSGVMVREWWPKDAWDRSRISPSGGHASPMPPSGWTRLRPAPPSGSARGGFALP